MGCVLVKTEIFKKLSRPYFRYSYDPEKDATHLKLSEDMYWCAQLKKAGVPILIDPSVQCGHLMEMESDVDLYENHRDTLIEVLKETKPKEHAKLLSEILDVRQEQKELPNGSGNEKEGHSKEGDRNQNQSNERRVQGASRS